MDNYIIQKKKNMLFPAVLYPRPKRSITSLSASAQYPSSLLIVSQVNFYPTFLPYYALLFLFLLQPTLRLLYRSIPGSFNAYTPMNRRGDVETGGGQT